MTKDDAKLGESSSQFRRQHRDRPERRESGSSLLWPTTHGPGSPTLVRDADAAAPGSAEQALAQGRFRLRFAPPIEAQFLAQTLEPRRRLLLIGGAIGIVAIFLASLNQSALMPDAVALGLRDFYCIAGAAILTLLLTWAIPPRWRRNWQGEAATSFVLLVLNAGVIHQCTISRADTMLTHSIVVMSSVMYSCIVARLRFVWALGSSLVFFLAYVAIVKGHTPDQVLIVASNIRLMAVSYLFMLVANFAFEYTERRNWLLRKVEHSQRHALREKSDQLRQLSTLDPLTRLWNRRQFDAELALAWSDASVARQPLVLMIADVDFFKRFNDTYGHAAGDDCLVRVSQVLATTAAANGAQAARLGGEEFGLILRGGSQAQAERVAAQICESTRALALEHKASSAAPYVTLSLGYALMWPEAKLQPSQLIDLADRALYWAKEAGRDRACAAPAPGAAQGLEAGAMLGQLGQEPLDSAIEAAAKSQVLPEATYTRILKDKFFTLKFPPEQERVYVKHNAKARRHELTVMSVVGLLIFNAFAWSNRGLYPDIAPKVGLWQLAMTTAFLGMIAGLYVVRMPIRWREGVFSSGNALLGVLSAWALAQSGSLTTLPLSVSLTLIPMFSSVGARQPFVFTCIPALLTCAAAILLFHPVGANQALMFSDCLVTTIINTAFTLILSYSLEYGARKEWLLSQVQTLQSESLLATNRSLHKLAILDPLTGIYNRRQFENHFQRIWAESKALGKALSILIIDVDYFKRYNDSYGHPEGDRCLKQVASIISAAALEHQCMAARLGGEEFGVLLPQSDLSKASELAELVCTAVRQAGIEHRYTQVQDQAIVTVSIGVATAVAQAHTDRRELFAMADQALYQAKQAGRNRVATKSSLLH